MGLIEKDPRDVGYVALYLAINWYRQITSEQALRLARGESNMLPPKRLNSETMKEINKIIRNPNFKNYKNIEMRFRINRYDVYEELKKQKLKNLYRKRRDEKCLSR